MLSLTRTAQTAFFVIAVALCCPGIPQAVLRAADEMPTAAAPQPASTVPWLQEYNLARIKGIEESRPVLLFVTTDNCIYCTRMYDQAFRDEAIINQLKQNFVPAQLKLDPHSELAQQLRITIYPTTVIIATDGTILDYARGFLSTDDLRTRMSRVTEPVEHIAALPEPK